MVAGKRYKAYQPGIFQGPTDFLKAPKSRIYAGIGYEVELFPSDNSGDDIARFRWVILIDLLQGFATV